ncbi:MAG: prepilin-type N-terminal cleavage/methylation domain-containing protein [Polyangiaceae bacterium]|nr:prepilin-type N-terminal cleavage/methylation domain-containing protein [Polyangiaceae bacterium]
MRGRGFTLLEVMVAIAILGLALTVILSAQAGAFANAALARNMSVATGLARCKMTELEEHLQRDGFQELDEADTGPCCEGDETPGMHCSWKIEKPELPEPKYGELNLDTDIGSSDLGALGELSKGAEGASLGPDAKLGDIAQSLAGAGDTGATPEGAAGAAQGMLGTVMSIVYPDIKSLFEASTRRVTVKLTWTQGSREQSIELVQWFTIPQKGLPPKVADDGSGEVESDPPERTKD